MILAKKLWDNVVKYLTENYDFNESLIQDFRFAFAIYWFMVNKNVDETEKSTRYDIFSDYKSLFKSVDSAKFTAFERAIYRKFDLYRKEDEIMLIDLVNNIRDNI